VLSGSGNLPVVAVGLPTSEALIMAGCWRGSEACADAGRSLCVPGSEFLGKSGNLPGVAVGIFLPKAEASFSVARVARQVRKRENRQP
jgi:hypothetical protein